MSLAAEYVAKIFEKKGSSSSKLIKQLTSYARLLLKWEQHVRDNDIREKFLWCKYNDSTKRYDWNEDNKDFKRFIKGNYCQELDPFQGGMYGLYDPLFDFKMIVCVIVTIPIVTNYDQ